MADKRTTGKQGSGMSFFNKLCVIRSELGSNFVVIDAKTDKAIEKDHKLSDMINSRSN